MSRIGKLPITIPQNVTVDVNQAERVVTVKGPKGEISTEYRPEIKVKVKDNEVITEVAKETKESSALWGLTRALIANNVNGVVDGYEKKLELVGVGYRITSNTDTKLVLAVGYSHPVEVEAPEGITFEVEDKVITIKGIDKHMVGQTAANIRKIRKPEPYKGKGIKYTDEVIRRKAGKAAKAV